MSHKILLLHGALGSKKQLNSLKNNLSEKFEVYDLDFSGHGGNSVDKEFSIQLFTENVVQFLEENGLDKIDVFGYSMGGYVALNVAKANPKLMNRIMTLGTKFDWTMESAKREVKMLNPEKIEEKVPKFAEKLKKDHYPEDWKKVMKSTASMMIGMAEEKRLTDSDLRFIGNEVLVGIGEKDEMVTLEESKKASKELPNGRLKIIEELRHPIALADANLLARTFEEFIENSK